MTSPAFAEDVYIGAVNGVDLGGQRATFVVPVNAPGVTVICRKASARDANPFSAPLSSRYDELDGQMWLDDVAVPWNRVFLTEPSPEPVARWLFWHQLYCWLAKAEFTLGLALACTQAMGLAAHEPTIEYLLDLITDVQTVRSCQTATELDPEFTAEGYCSPNHGHLAAGSLAMLKARRRMAEILRILPGSSLVVAPTDRDLADPALAGGLEESFGGGGYSARAAGGPAADGVGPCRLGARSSRACLRAACQRRRVRLARPVAPTLRPLQRAGQRRPAAASACRCRRSTWTRSATRRWRHGGRSARWRVSRRRRWPAGCSENFSRRWPPEVVGGYFGGFARRRSSAGRTPSRRSWGSGRTPPTAGGCRPRDRAAD